MSKQQVDRLGQRRARLEEQLAEIRRREADARRRVENRQMIVLGAAVLAEFHEKTDARRYLTAMIRRRVPHQDLELVRELVDDGHEAEQEGETA